jgi:hypothetical protein
MDLGLPGKEYLQPIAGLFAWGERCPHHHRQWAIYHEATGAFFTFDSQSQKDAWVAEARSQIGLAATLKMLHHFCPKCRIVQKH